MASLVAASINPRNYFGGVHFVPDRDIPDLTGKVVLVTGGKFKLIFMGSHRDNLISLQEMLVWEKSRFYN